MTETAYVQETRQGGPPRLLAFVLVLLAVLTFGQAIYFQAQRNADIKAQGVQFKAITDELKRRQDEADRERARIEREAQNLEALVQALMLAKNSNDESAAFAAFLEAQRRSNAQANSSSSSSSSPQPNPSPGPSPSRSPNPTPKPSNSPSPTPACTVQIEKPVKVCQ